MPNTKYPLNTAFLGHSDICWYLVKKGDMGKTYPKSYPQEFITLIENLWLYKNFAARIIHTELWARTCLSTF